MHGSSNGMQSYSEIENGFMRYSKLDCHFIRNAMELVIENLCTRVN